MTQSRYVYTTALYVLGKARRPVEALNVFNAMLVKCPRTLFILYMKEHKTKKN